MKLRKCSNCRGYWWLTIMCVVQYVYVHGQTLQQGEQIIPLSLGAYRIENNTAFITVHRPAAGIFTPKKTIGIYGENRFMLKQIANIQGALNIPVQSVLLSLSGQYHGTRFLSTQSIGTGIGLKLSPRLSTGIKISSHWLKINSISPIHTMIVDGGLLYKINDKILWGLHIRTSSTINKTQKMPSEKPQLIAGIGYSLNKQLFIAFETSASSMNELQATAGVEWWATDNIHFRGGINKPLSNFFITAGNKGKRETISIGFSTHAVLGYSGAILFEYALH